MGSAVRVDHVWKYYGDYPALRDVAFDLPAGSCLALIGRNGAGKTTLLRILAGLTRSSKGSVAMFGQDSRADAVRRKVGFLGHGIGIYDELSAYENLVLFGRFYGMERPQDAASEWLERVGLDRVRDGLPREFSRGMRQRLALARVFLHRPQLLLLDEPFTALDDRAIALLQGLVSRARNAGATVIMSTHQLREALELSSDVAFIQRGALAFYGERTQEMVDDPGWVYRNWPER